MRLVRLNDMVIANRPLHSVMRDGSGAGTILHWSHLLDSLLLFLAAPLAPILGWHNALHVAGLLSGPLGMAGMGAAIAWAAAPLASPAWLWLGAFAAGGAPALSAYGMLGVVHHHTLLTIVPVMISGWAVRLLLNQTSPRTAGMATGAWMAAGLWLSPETLPFSLMAAGAIAAAWLQHPGKPTSRGLCAAGVTFFTLTLLAWLVDPPAAGLRAIEPDRLSLPFVIMAFALTVVAWSTSTGNRVVVVVWGIIVAALWTLAFPQLLHGTNSLMLPEQAAAFFSGIQEMAPMRTISAAIECLMGGLFAVVSLAAFISRRKSTLTVPASYALLCCIIMIVLAFCHARFASYPEAAGAVSLPIVLTAISRAGFGVREQACARLTCIVTLLGLPPITALAQAPSPQNIGQSCSMDGAVRLLTPYGGQIVLAGVNETPDLLYQTGVLTVGSLYHRNPAAFMRLRAAWRSIPTAKLDEAVGATHATLVLGCPGQARSALLAGLPPTTLLDRLNAGHPPKWLRKLSNDAPGGYVLYAVDSGRALNQSFPPHS